MRALVTGATGFIGQRLLEKLDRPVVLSRNVQRAQESLKRFSAKAFAWNPESEPAPAAAFEGVEAVFHLAGDPVAEGRWTEAKRKRIRDSRVLGTRNLVATLRSLPHKPQVLVSGSAVGFYGDRGDAILTETDGPGNDFLADVCKDWEQEALAAADAGIRVVTVRTGVVLGPNGGALAKMLTPFKLGVGSALGSGKQYMPWIHLDDLVGILLAAADNVSLSGPVNGCAPDPVTNRDFTKALGKALHRPTFFPPVPGFMLKLMFGEFGQVLLDSQRCEPRAALEAGYRFKYPEVGGALADLFKAA